MVARSRPFASTTVEHPLWTATIDALQRDLSAAHLEGFRREAQVIEIGASRLRIALPHALAHAWVRGGQLSLLDAAVATASSDVCELHVLPLTAPAPPLPIDPGHTLEHFVVSPSNQTAHAAVTALVEHTPDRANPLLLYGATGSGKTHLLRAVAQAFAQSDRSLQIHYLTGEDLSLELIDAIRGAKLAEFQHRYRNCHALCIDDLDGLVGREASQAELAQAIDTLLPKGVPVTFGASKDALRLSGLSPALHSVLAAGRSIELFPPEWETRVAIVFDRVERWGISVEPEVASFLAAKLEPDLSELDGLLTRLMAHPAGAESLSDVESARQALERRRGRPPRFAPETVITLVARHFNLRRRDFRSATHTPRVTTPRQIAIYLVRRHCGLSYPEIGRRFSRHHTTALYAYRRISRRLEDNGDLRATVRLLEKDLLQTLEDGG